MMKRWLPYPLLTAFLVAVWLLLNQSIAPGTIILGIVFACAAAWALAALDPPTTRFRRPGTALKLALDVLAEIIRSNNAVAWLILRNHKRDRRSGFVRIPLHTRNPYCLAALACIITATPGTIWVEYDSSDNTMLLHVLDLIDEQQWVTIVKERYENRLMEIFE
jgi:multicomponent K+:H+ antiporter subunit E